MEYPGQPNTVFSNRQSASNQLTSALPTHLCQMTFLIGSLLGKHVPILVLSPVLSLGILTGSSIMSSLLALALANAEKGSRWPYTVSVSQSN